MRVNAKVDYLTFTTTQFAGEIERGNVVGETLQIAFFAQSELTGVQSWEFESYTPARFYNWAWKSKTTGMVVHVAENLDRQGVKVEFSGQHVDRAAAHVRSRISDVRAFWRISRVDIAFDVYDAKATAKQTFQAYMKAYPEENRKRRLDIDERGAATFNIGSRVSDKYLRVYDKGLEQNTVLDWIRAEIELKGDVAKEYAFDAVENPLFVVGTIIRMMKDVDCKLVQALRTAANDLDAITLSIPKVKGDTVLWLEKQVKGAIIKAYQARLPGVEDWVRDLLDELRSNGYNG